MRSDGTAPESRLPDPLDGAITLMTIAERIVRRLLPGRRPAGGAAPARSAGQSVAELAMILPVLLTMTGAILDFARVFQAQNTLDSATRNAAESIATFSTTLASAQSSAATIICAEMVGSPGFVAATCGTAANSSTPKIVVELENAVNEPGYRSSFPIYRAKVVTTYPFRTFFPYPLLTQGGVWTLSATHEFKIAQGL